MRAARHYRREGRLANGQRSRWPRRALWSSVLCGVLAACSETHREPFEDDDEVSLACARGDDETLEQRCADERWHEACERHATYEQALASALENCGTSLSSVLVGECELLSVTTGASFTNVTYYFDPTSSELVGIMTVDDQLFTCPPGSPRQRTAPVVRIGRTVDEQCAPRCLVCAGFDAPLWDADACTGAVAGPQVERCLERGAASMTPVCAQCACEHCYPYVGETLLHPVRFQECAEEACDACEPCDATADAGTC